MYVGEVGLWAPQIHVRRYANQHLNWQDVVAKLKELGGVAPNETPVADKLRRDVGLKVAPKTEVARADAPKPDAPKPDATTPDAAKSDSASPDASKQGAAKPAADAPAPAPATAAASGPTTAAAPGITAAAGTPAAPGSDAAPPPPAAPEEWKVTLDAFNLHEGELYITDAISKLDYVMTGMAVTVEGVALPEVKDQPVNLWLTVDNSTDGGWIRAKGPLVLKPLSLELGVRLGNVALAPLAPAVRSVAPIVLLDGRLGAAAQVHVLEKNGVVDASATAVQADLTQFKARDESLKPALDIALQTLRVTADRLAMGPGQSNFTLAAAGIQGLSLIHI